MKTQPSLNLSNLILLSYNVYEFVVYLWSCDSEACALLVFFFQTFNIIFAKISQWNQISAMNTTISFSFCFSGHVPRSSSMAMSAMRAPMARHHLKTQCMTPTWSLLRLRQFDSIPHSIQSALWYSPTSLPLPIQWFGPASLLQLAVWFNQTEKKEPTYDFWLVTESTLCCSMLVPLSA